jgi:hypothetical protein
MNQVVENARAIKNIFIVVLSLTLTACSNYRPAVGPGTNSSSSTGDGGAQYALFPLAWEGHAKGSVSWSQFLYSTILTNAPALLAGSSDVTQFCANYPQLTNNQRANFWAYLLSQVSYYESSYDPTSRYVETTMGTDPITGAQVVSEGLLQLSYQDQQRYPFCQFNWNADAPLSPSSPKKTILDPFVNLQCGALILNSQVKARGLIEVSKGAYWSTLQTTSSHNKLAQIKAATQKIPFCAR